jgi:hypothetical protein
MRASPCAFFWSGPDTIENVNAIVVFRLGGWRKGKTAFSIL